MNKLKILFFSDSHGYHDLPHFKDFINNAINEHKIDVIICGGDFMRSANSYASFSDFMDWYKSLPGLKLVIPGNHDMWCEQLESDGELLLNVTPDGVELLINKEITINGFKFYGSPYTPEFNSWGFQLYGDDGKEQWSKIPEDVDVLITHGPAKGVLDTINNNPWDVNFLGCPFLKEKIDKLNNLKAHLFGHIHGSYGIQKLNDYTAYNGAVLDESYRLVNEPHIIEIKKEL